MSSEKAAMEAGACPHREQIPEVSAKKLWRVLRAVYLVLVKGLGKHQPKLAALGVHLHHLLSKRHHHHDGHHGLAAAVREHPALTYLSSTLSCRSMDPAAAVVHPYPARAGTGYSGGARGGGGGGSAGGLSSLSCRSMDAAAAVYQYQYRPREVEFSCSSTPLHKRRRAQRRQLRLQHGAGAGGDVVEYGSAAAVTKLFELFDVKEAAVAGDDDLEISAAPWTPAAAGPAPRQVRITDSPFPARGEDDEEGRGVVDRRADEFIMWFHEQLRMQQPRAAAAAAPATTERSSSYYWVR